MPINMMSGLADSLAGNQTTSGSVEAFEAKIAVSTECALHPVSSTGIRSYCQMFAQVARDRWEEAKADYENLKQQDI